MVVGKSASTIERADTLTSSTTLLPAVLSASIRSTALLTTRHRCPGPSRSAPPPAGRHRRHQLVVLARHSDQQLVRAPGSSARCTIGWQWTTNRSRSSAVLIRSVQASPVWCGAFGEAPGRCSVHGVTARVLGLVHGDVPLDQQLFGRQLGAVEERDPDARRDPQSPARRPWTGGPERGPRGWSPPSAPRPHPLRRAGCRTRPRPSGRPRPRTSASCPPAPATLLISSSPAWCPKASLTYLKLSRSRISSAPPPP